AILRIAAEHGVSLVPTGCGSKLEVGNSPDRDFILLKTTRLNELQFFDPGDLTIGVGAGMSLAKLRATVAEHKLFFPVDPPLAAQASVGGALATAAQGPLKHFYGGLRDFCIGLQFVTGDGKIAKGG